MDCVVRAMLAHRNDRAQPGNRLRGAGAHPIVRHQRGGRHIRHTAVGTQRIRDRQRWAGADGHLLRTAEQTDRDRRVDHQPVAPGDARAEQALAPAKHGAVGGQRQAGFERQGPGPHGRCAAQARNGPRRGAGNGHAAAALHARAERQNGAIGAHGQRVAAAGTDACPARGRRWRWWRRQGAAAQADAGHVRAGDRARSVRDHAGLPGRWAQHGHGIGARSGQGCGERERAVRRHGQVVGAAVLQRHRAAQAGDRAADLVERGWRATPSFATPAAAASGQPGRRKQRDQPRFQKHPHLRFHDMNPSEVLPSDLPLCVGQ